MKKLVLVLAVLLVSLPAMAATVTINADCDSGVYEVSYETDGNLPRAFALDIEVDAGTIDAVDTSMNTAYDIYPGSIVIIDNDINDPGSAVCGNSYPDTLGGIGTAGVTIEMGSLYADSDPAPDTSGVLFTFTVSDTAAVVTITENGIRGGIVMEDPEEPVVFDPNIVPCDIFCLADLNGDKVISLIDMSMLYGMLGQAGPPYSIPVPPGNPAADLNGDNVISLIDMSMLYGMLGQAGPPYSIPCP